VSAATDEPTAVLYLRVGVDVKEALDELATETGLSMRTVVEELLRAQLRLPRRSTRAVNAALRRWRRRALGSEE
jgi:hypothetical protein